MLRKIRLNRTVFISAILVSFVIIPSLTEAQQAKDTNEINGNIRTIKSLTNLREFSAAYKLSHETLEKSKRKRYKEGEAWSKYYLGITHFELTQSDSAIFWLKKAEDDFRFIQNNLALIQTMNQIGTFLRRTDSNQQSINYYNKALELATRIKDTSGLADSQYGLASVLNQSGKYQEALELFLSTLKLHENLNNEKGKASVLNSMGVIFWNQGDYSKALELFTKSLTYREKIDDIQGIAFEHNNIGLIQRELGEFDKALEHLRLSWQYKIQIKDVRGISNSLMNIASVYILQGKLDSALVYLDQSYDIKLQAKDRSGVSYIEKLRGDAYLQLGLYNQALNHFRISKETYANLKEPKGLAESCLGIAYTYEKTHNYSRALSELNDVYLISTKHHMIDLKEKLFKTRYEIYQILGDCQNSLESFKNYILVKDSMKNEESVKKVLLLQLESEYDSIVKESNQLRNQEVAKLKGQKKIRNFIIIILLVAFCFITILFLILYINYKNNKRRNNMLLKQQMEVDVQKQELVTQRDEIERQKNLVIYQRDKIINMLTDLGESIDYAKKIQQALLPNDEQFGKYFRNHCMLYLPKETVGGDFYWLGQVESKVNFAVADCTGHGVPGGFMSMLGISMLNDMISKELKFTPATFLSTLRQNIITALRQGASEDESHDGMDIAFCSLDSRTRELCYAGANMAIMVRTEMPIEPSERIWKHADDLIELRPDRMPIGYYDKMDSFEELNLTLNPGDLVYMFSDGYLDQFGGDKGRKFGYTAFRTLIKSIKHLPLNEQRQELWTTLEKWKGERENQTDDIIVLIVQIY
ncbi:MAG: tetratricopeptide repeat protein [Bacteroidales bacterium]|nr:tetratricopeptide repeat protein [Bacteroidales bacterium]